MNPISPASSMRTAIFYESGVELPEHLPGPLHSTIIVISKSGIGAYLVSKTLGPSAKIRCSTELVRYGFRSAADFSRFKTEYSTPQYRSKLATLRGSAEHQLVAPALRRPMRQRGPIRESNCIPVSGNRCPDVGVAAPFSRDRESGVTCERSMHRTRYRTAIAASPLRRECVR
jgi:hypothetical protein